MHGSLAGYNPSPHRCMPSTFQPWACRDRTIRKVVARFFLIPFLVLLSACATHPGKVGFVRSASDYAEPVLRTPEGELRGMRGAGVRAFLGVPYAVPPVGELRWRAPRPVQPWAGTRDATRIGEDCTQALGPKSILGGGGGVVFGSEDCLYLNIYGPAVEPERLRPVIVYLPGGAFTVGAGANYDPSRLAVEQDRVVVTVNYRLGALGWLAHPEFAADGEGVGGNWGLMDQQAALRWVHQRIAAFGGDSRDVTLIGESAGAWSACHLMTSPASEGLFQRVILQSGTCVEPGSLWSADEAAGGGETFAASVGCEGPNAVACLRAAPAGRIARAASTRSGLNGPGSWGPIYGDATVPLAPPLAFVQGRFTKVPVIVGSNRDEGRLFAVKVRDTERYRAQTLWMYGDDGPGVLDRYPIGPEGPGATMARSFTDQKFACPADALRRVLARYVPVWGYEFADPDAPFALSALLNAPYDLGAYHASEATYVFGTKWIFADPARFTPEQRALSDRMMRLWAGFGHDADFEAGWPRAADSGLIRVFQPTGDVMDDGFAARSRCDFWATTRFGPVAPR